jgi:hypothetical protein
VDFGSERLDEAVIASVTITQADAGSPFAPVSQGDKLDWERVELYRRPADFDTLFVIGMFGAIKCIGCHFGVVTLWLVLGSWLEGMRSLSQLGGLLAILLGIRVGSRG